MSTIDVCLKAAIEQLAIQTKLAIENGDAGLGVIIDGNYEELTAKIDALTSEGLAEQLAALKSLLETLDLDKDNSVVNDLLNIKGIAEQALDAALTAGENADSANDKADSLLQQLAAYQTATNTRLSAIDSTISNHSDAIAALQECCNSAVTQRDIDDSIKLNNDKVCTALSEGVALFTSILNGDNPPAAPSDGDIV